MENSAAFTLSSQNISEGNIGYTGDGTSGKGITESYSNLRTLLLNHEGSADDITSVNSLPNTPSLQGHSSFVIGTAQGKALGIVSPSAGAIDGQVGMGTGFTGNALIAAALHEITHAMGRIAGDSLDLFRFNEDRSGDRVYGFARPSKPGILFDRWRRDGLGGLRHKFGHQRLSQWRRAGRRSLQ